MKLKLDPTPQVQAARAAEYPPLQELADAIYWQEHGDQKPMRDYLAKVKAVKDRYPKPQARE